MPVQLHVYHLCVSALRFQKKESHHLKLLIQEFVNHSLEALGTEAISSVSSKCSYPLRHLSSPSFAMFYSLVYVFNFLNNTNNWFS